MSQVLRLVATAVILGAFIRLAAAARGLRSTTLRGASVWSLVALGSWTAVLMVEFVQPLPTAVLDVWWYSTAVLAVCPSIAVLGARRPGAFAWTWFVLLPLVLVLGLPVWTTVYQMAADGGFDRRVALETPLAIGFAFVVVMGAGNYAGTRHTPAAALYALSLVLLTGPLVHTLEEVFPSRSVTRVAATVCAAVAVLLPGRLQAGSRSTQPLERLCLDFRDWFGIVWSRRVFDRVNEALAARQLPLRLDLGGLVWLRPAREIDAAVTTESLQHAEATLRWLLKRFVEPDWIEERIGVKE